MTYLITNVVCFTFICSTCAMVHIERSRDNIPESVFASYHVEPENRTQHFRDWTQALNIFTQDALHRPKFYAFISLAGETLSSKNTCCSPKGLGFSSQHPHTGSVPHIYSFSSTGPDTLFWCQTDNRHTCGATHIHIKLNSKEITLVWGWDKFRGKATKWSVELRYSKQ